MLISNCFRIFASLLAWVLTLIPTAYKEICRIVKLFLDIRSMNRQSQNRTSRFFRKLILFRT